MEISTVVNPINQPKRIVSSCEASMDVGKGGGETNERADTRGRVG